MPAFMSAESATIPTVHPRIRDHYSCTPQSQMWVLCKTVLDPHGRQEKVLLTQVYRKVTTVFPKGEYFFIDQWEQKLDETVDADPNHPDPSGPWMHTHVEGIEYNTASARKQWNDFVAAGAVVVQL